MTLIGSALVCTLEHGHRYVCRVPVGTGITMGIVIALFLVLALIRTASGGDK